MTVLLKTTHTKPENIPGVSAYFGGFIVPVKRENTQEYMKGDCPHLALAMHSLIPGSQLWEIGGQHFAVEDAIGNFWDIRGKMTIEQLWSGLPGKEMNPTTREDVISALETGVYRCGFYSQRRESKARRLLKSIMPQDAILSSKKSRKTPGL